MKMDKMIIFNCITNIIIIIYLIIYIFKKNFYISANKTFWMKKVCSFSLMKKDSENSAHSAHDIFHISIPFRNYIKMSEWDNKQFHNGNYAKKERSKNNA